MVFVVCVVNFICNAVYSKKWSYVMAKLKLKLEDIDYELDGTPDELGNLVKILKDQQRRATEDTKQILIASNPPESKNNLKELFSSSSLTETLLIPSVDSVVKYLYSKKDFEHHTKELQERFLGGVIKYRGNEKIYGAFDRIIREARDIIARDYNGTWDNSETRNLGGRTNVTIYKFKKSNEGVSPILIPTLSSEKSTQSIEKWV